jgi:endonuclease/exonuclease/phosphatase family metal-dependent hydrolase
MQNLSFLLAALSVPTPAQAACLPLRVMTYNIRLDLAADGVNRWSARRDFLVGQVGLMKPGLLGLQEVVPGQKTDLEGMLPGYAFLGLPREDGKSKGEYSNLAIDRAAFRVRASGTFWLSPTPDKPSKGWDAAFSRIATWARLTRVADGKRLLVLNSHFDHRGEVAKLEGAKQVAAWLKTNRRPGETVIMLGDLNSTPDSPPLSALTGDGGLRDSRAASVSPPIGPEGTFNAFVTVPNDSKRIDYVLTDPDVAVERHAVLAWHGDGGRVASDHWPVVADLKVCR